MKFGRRFTGHSGQHGPFYACVFVAPQIASRLSESRAAEYFYVAALQKPKRHKSYRSLVRAHKESHNSDAPQLATVASGAACASVFFSLQTRYYLWRFEHPRGKRSKFSIKVL